MQPPCSFGGSGISGNLAILTQRLDWTNGAVAVTNAGMDEVRATVPTNTPIESML
jgi:hypothetical protein